MWRRQTTRMCLHLAAEHGSSDVVRMLLNSHARDLAHQTCLLKAKDEVHQTCLHLAAEQGSSGGDRQLECASTLPQSMEAVTLCGCC